MIPDDPDLSVQVADHGGSSDVLSKLTFFQGKTRRTFRPADFTWLTKALSVCRDEQAPAGLAFLLCGGTHHHRGGRLDQRVPCDQESVRYEPERR